MTSVLVAGVGAVTPGGWGWNAFRQTLNQSAPVPTTRITPPPHLRSLPVRTVPRPEPRPAFLAHARLRRASPISHFAVGAALEALGQAGPAPGERLAVLFASHCGSVRYSARFYAETLADPSTASPLIFPETVFNAPASHLAAILGVTGECHTLIGDAPAFLQALAWAANWLVLDRADAALVVAAEELDWMVPDAWRPFSREMIPAEGAGALYLRRGPLEPGCIRLDGISDPVRYAGGIAPAEAGRMAVRQLPPAQTGECLVTGHSGRTAADRLEDEAWGAWAGPICSPARLLGQGLTAGAAWQCLAAVNALQHRQAPAARVGVLGPTSQAIAARFTACPGTGEPTLSAP